VSVRIFIVSFTGMFEYRLVMSRDASVKCGVIGVSCSFWSKSVVFFTLKVFGSGAMLFIFCVNSLERWYAGALRQFTTGLTGCPGLCNFISPLMEGAEGFRLTYFHLMSAGISVLLCFMVFLMSVWKELVGSLLVMVKLLQCRKSYLGVILLCGEYDYEIAFVSFSHHGIVLLQFGSDGVYQSGLGVCVMCGVWVVSMQYVYAVRHYFSLRFSLIGG